MPTQYSLTVVNKSTQFQDLCVYQQPVDLGVRNAMSLAWLTAPAWPNTIVTFEWTLDYCFAWSYTGSLKPGTRFRAQDVRRANPQDLTTNQILFDYTDGAIGPRAPDGPSGASRRTAGSSFRRRPRPAPLDSPGAPTTPARRPGR